jgi:hypothetical protein
MLEQQGDEGVNKLVQIAAKHTFQRLAGLLEISLQQDETLL